MGSGCQIQVYSRCALNCCVYLVSSMCKCMELWEVRRMDRNNPNIERLVSLRPSAAAQSVVCSSRAILSTPSPSSPRQPCPSTTPLLQISSAATTA